MLVNQQNLDGLFKGYNTLFNRGLGAAASQYKEVAMVTPSTTGSETYAWLKNLPKAEEWVGKRKIRSLSTTGFALTNKTFEQTIGVPRTAIEDDQYGVFGPLFEAMGAAAGEIPDELVFSTLAAGFTTPCFDGQNFFDTDHPVTDEHGQEQSQANTDGGAGEAWYLLDTSKPIKPLVYQNRIAPVLTSKTQDGDDNVFFQDEYLYGTRSRGAGGFGLWQLAWASKQELNVANYSSARAAMWGRRGDYGRVLNVKPDTLVVPPSMEAQALEILNAANNEAGASNVWSGTAKLIVSPWLAA